MPNVTKKNLIIVWKRNHLFTKNYFRKKKINYCYWFMPGDLQVICGSMVGKNRQSPDSTETHAYKETFFLSAVKILRYRALIFVAYAELLALLHFCTPPPIVIDDSSWKNTAASFTVSLILTLGGHESAIAPNYLSQHETE